MLVSFRFQISFFLMQLNRTFFKEEQALLCRLIRLQVPSLNPKRNIP